MLIGRDGGRRTIDPATGEAEPVSEERIFEAARRLLPDAALTMRQRLAEPDAYCYSHHQQRLLPVLRAGFDDDAHAWFHIDPTTGDILGRTDSAGALTAGCSMRCIDLISRRCCDIARLGSPWCGCCRCGGRSFR